MPSVKAAPLLNNQDLLLRHLKNWDGEYLSNRLPTGFTRLQSGYYFVYLARSEIPNVFFVNDNASFDGSKMVELLFHSDTSIYGTFVSLSSARFLDTPPPLSMEVLTAHADSGIAELLVGWLASFTEPFLRSMAPIAYTESERSIAANAAFPASPMAILKFTRNQQIKLKGSSHVRKPVTRVLVSTYGWPLLRIWLGLCDNNHGKLPIFGSTPKFGSHQVESEGPMPPTHSNS